MKNKRLIMKPFRFVLLFFLCFYISGCVGEFKNNEVKNMVQTYKAIRANKAVVIDGKLDDEVWQQGFSYQLFLSKDNIDSGQVLQEAGYVKFAWDDEYFYLAADFKDSDIIVKGTEDQMHHYRYGDLCELFMKPVDENYYWELYVTPFGKKTSFFFPSKDYLTQPDVFEKYSCGLKVAAEIDGTLNNQQDKDNSWTAEMAMPIKDLEAFGCKFGPDQKWTVLVGRYNYSGGLDQKELSMTPQLSKTFYHLLNEYAALEFVK